MAYELPQLSFAEILDRSFRLLRDQFVLLTGISACLYVPFAILRELARSPTRPLLAIAVVLLVIALVPVTHAALTVAIGDTYLERPTSIGHAYRVAFHILTPLLGTYVLMMIFIIPAFLLLIIPGVYLSVCWALLSPVMVVERRFGMDALRRSRDLVRGHWWRTLGCMVVSGILVAVLGGGLNALWAFIPIVGPLLTALTQSITATLGLAVVVVLYLDLRCRHDDFDLHRLADHIRGTARGVTADDAPAAAPAS